MNFELPAQLDRHNGINVSLDGVIIPPDQFGAVLMTHLDQWRKDGLDLVWMSLARSQARLIPIAVEAGFLFHRTHNDTLMLVRPLREGVYYPPVPSHYIGVGSVVLNADDEILTIVEQGHVKKRPNFYKLPGGLVDQGEHIADAAVREIWEETGIRAQFRSLHFLRQRHREMFGKSNIYFVCRCDPLTHEIVLDPGEIAKCSWMPLTTYLGHPDIHPFNKTIVHACLNNDGLHQRPIDGYDVDLNQVEVYRPPIRVSGKQ